MAVKKQAEIVKAAAAPVVEKKEAAVVKTAAAPAAEKKETEKKPVEKKEAVKKDAVKKETVKKETVKKAAVKTVKTTLCVQANGNDYNEKALVAAAKKAYVALGNKASDVKTIDIYVNVEEKAAYYVVNGVGSADYKICL